MHRTPTPKARLIQSPGNVRTYFDDASTAARRSGLTLENVVADVEDGSGITIEDQDFDSSTGQIRFQLSFNQPGEALIRLTTTFASSRETIVERYHAICLTKRGGRPIGDCVGYR